MKRIIVIVKEENLEALRALVGPNIIAPCPGTKADNGDIVADILLPDNTNMKDIDNKISIYMGKWSKQGKEKASCEKAPESKDFLKHLKDTVTYDNDGNVISITPAVMHEPHRWLGMEPEVFK